MVYKNLFLLEFAFREDNFYKNLKENNIFLLHSKENKCGIISKLFISLIHPETKGINITLYSVTNDIKVGIPLW